jgi:hypothetical protein
LLRESLPFVLHARLISYDSGFLRNAPYLGMVRELAREKDGDTEISRVDLDS